MMMDEECFSKVYLAERRSTREEVMIMIIIHDDYDCMWTRFMMMLRDIKGRVYLTEMIMIITELRLTLKQQLLHPN